MDDELQHHEQSETVQDPKTGKWINVYGKGTKKAGQRLPGDASGLGHREYGTLGEAVEEAKRRSKASTHGYAAGGYVKKRRAGYEDGGSVRVTPKKEGFLGKGKKAFEEEARLMKERGIRYEDRDPGDQHFMQPMQPRESREPTPNEFERDFERMEREAYEGKYKIQRLAGGGKVKARASQADVRRSEAKDKFGRDPGDPAYGESRDDRHLHGQAVIDHINARAQQALERKRAGTLEGSGYNESDIQRFRDFFGHEPDRYANGGMVEQRPAGYADGGLVRRRRFEPSRGERQGYASGGMVKDTSRASSGDKGLSENAKARFCRACKGK